MQKHILKQEATVSRPAMSNPRHNVSCRCSISSLHTDNLSLFW